MSDWLQLLIFIVFISTLFYHRASLKIWTVALPLYLLYLTAFSGINSFILLLLWIGTIGLLVVLNSQDLRKQLFTLRVYNFAKGQLPKISASEREALQAGTVSWDSELFSGMPDWNKLMSYKPVQYTKEELDFINGPATEICNNNYTTWDLFHKDIAFKPDLVKKVNKDGYLGMIIPKEYGGLEFSVLATWQVIMKIGGALGPLTTHIVISNSIGAAELIERYGTDKQKKDYLAKLAKGEEIACFALTSPVAGSDATSIEDYGIVCHDKYKGKKVLGIRLNFDKRYMTIGPLATVASLAFRLYDPDHLLGTQEDLGVTVALVPTDTPGFDNSRRHYPIGVAFPNGPLRGKDVFIPLDNVLGGKERIGRAWEMLTQALATGRATSLPTGAAAAAKEAFYFAAVYAGIRKQFGVTIGSFQGIQEKLAQQAGYTFMIDATRLFTFSQIQAGERPAIPSAISKYNSTEMSRVVTTIAVDVMGGKGVMQGPNNPVADLYQSAPVGVTVEGANIMTRGLIVFGQGSIRCHPYILKEMAALENDDKDSFDQLIMKHTNFIFSNHVRSLILGLSDGLFVRANTPAPELKRYIQKITRLSANFALLSDISMIILGGRLKFMESLSGKFSDVFSHLFMATSVLKHYQDMGRPEDIWPIAEWSLETSLKTAQDNLYEILRNFPVRPIAWWLKIFIFPLGRSYKGPSDALAHEVANRVQSSRDVREKLAEGLHIDRNGKSHFNLWEDALAQRKKVHDLDKKIAKAAKEGAVKGYTYLQKVDDALKQKIISKEEHKSLHEAYEIIMKVINVDDFSYEELMAEK